MKPGVRTLGVAESYRRTRSTLSGVVVRASSVVDGFAFDTCTVGGLDATDAIVSVYSHLEREDIRYVMLGAVAPAWYNVVDLSEIADRIDRPVIAVTFEESDGLESGITDEFSGKSRDQRLELYRSLPPRQPVDIDDGTVYVRAVGISDTDAGDVVRRFTNNGVRPEPLRVARLAARAADAYRRRGQSDEVPHRSEEGPDQFDEGP